MQQDPIEAGKQNAKTSTGWISSLDSNFIRGWNFYAGTSVGLHGNETKHAGEQLSGQF